MLGCGRGKGGATRGVAKAVAASRSQQAAVVSSSALAARARAASRAALRAVRSSSAFLAAAAAAERVEPAIGMGEAQQERIRAQGIGRAVGVRAPGWSVAKNWRR